MFFDFDVPDIVETGSRRNEVSHNHVLFEAAKVIDTSQCGSFREDTSGVLERGCRDKTVGFERSFGDPEKNGLPFGRLTTLLIHLCVDRFECRFLNLVTPQECGVTRLSNPNFAKHLTNDDLDVLIVNFHPLQTVNFLHLVNQVLHERVWS